jgi:hypothetical protein
LPSSRIGNHGHVNVDSSTFLSGINGAKGIKPWSSPLIVLFFVLLGNSTQQLHQLILSFRLAEISNVFLKPHI